MQYRQIAKKFIFDKGAVTPMIAEDGAVYGEGKAFAAGQLAKANTARETVAEALSTKWKLNEDAKKAKKPKKR